MSKRVKSSSFREYCDSEYVSKLLKIKRKDFWLRIPDELFDAIDINMGNKVDVSVNATLSKVHGVLVKRVF